MAKIALFDKNARATRDMKDSAQELMQLYEILETMCKELTILQEEIYQSEKKYNKTLRRYAEAVGIQNVEVQFLELGTQSVSVDENGELKIEV